MKQVDAASVSDARPLYDDRTRERSPARRRRTVGLLALILCANFALSIAGDDWGLPYIWHTDEKIDPAVHMIHEHTLDPDYFINPHLHIYAMALAVKLAYALNPGHTVMLSMHRIWDLLDPANPDRRIQYMAMRLSRGLSALFALGTILTVFAIARRHWGEATALLAAAFLAVTMGLVNLAHFGTPESLLFLMMFLCLWACDRLITHGRLHDHRLPTLMHPARLRPDRARVHIPQEVRADLGGHSRRPVRRAGRVHRVAAEVVRGGVGHR